MILTKVITPEVLKAAETELIKLLSGIAKRSDNKFEMSMVQLLADYFGVPVPS